MPTMNLPDNPGFLKTYSDVLGVRQQQQALQTGQALQQTAQQEAQIREQQAWQEKQKTSEMQFMAMKAPQVLKEPQAYGPDGVLNADYVASQLAPGMPTTWPDVAQHIYNTQEAGIKVKTAALGFNTAERSSVATALSGPSQDPNFKLEKPSDLADFITKVKDTLPKEAAPMVDAVINGAQIPKAGPDGKPITQYTPLQSDGIKHHIQMLVNPLLAPTELAPKAGAMDVGGAVVPTVQAPGVAGGGITTGKPIGKSLAPTVVTPPGGIPQVWGGGKGVGGNAPIGSGAKGPAPTDQDMKNFGEYQQGLNSRVALASDALPRIKYIEDALANVRSGGGSQARAGIAQGLQALGAPQGLVDAVAGGNLSKLQEAEKLLFQTTLSGLRQSMQGDTAHVAEFSEANKVFPNIDTDPRAKQYILDLISRQGQRDFAEQQSLNEARKGGTFNAATWQGDYQKALREGKVPGVPTSMVPGGQKETMKSKSGRPMVKGPNGKWQYAD